MWADRGPLPPGWLSWTRGQRGVPRDFTSAFTHRERGGKKKCSKNKPGKACSQLHAGLCPQAVKPLPQPQPLASWSWASVAVGTPHPLSWNSPETSFLGCVTASLTPPRGHHTSSCQGWGWGGGESPIEASSSALLTPFSHLTPHTTHFPTNPSACFPERHVAHIISPVLKPSVAP